MRVHTHACVLNHLIVSYSSRPHGACQAPLSLEFSRQEYWSGLPFPTPGDLPNPGIKPASLASPALAGGFFTTVPPGKPQENHLPRLITEQDLMGPSIISSALAPL